MDMMKEEIYRFQEQFVEASVELQTEPFTDYMVESEDGGRGCISLGRQPGETVLSSGLVEAGDDCSRGSRKAIQKFSTEWWPRSTLKDLTNR